MISLAEIEQGIDALLSQPTYQMEPAERRNALLTLLKQELEFASDQNPKFRNYVSQWPVPFSHASDVAELPYLPVRVFKAKPPLALVEPDQIKRTLISSATTAQNPSRVVLDTATARRMTKSVANILRDFIGPSRRPYLIIDTPEAVKGNRELGARGAAIQALGPFATEMVCCLTPTAEGEPVLDLQKLTDFARRWEHDEVLIYGFTYLIWTQLVQTLERARISLNLRRAFVLHSGGWKRLHEQAVTRETFIGRVSSALGCAEDRVIDYYGMVENVGVVYPDCKYGYKHPPAFAEVIVRDPLTLAPVREGDTGLIQVCSVLPTSFPGFLLLTEDMAQVIRYDHCPCGRRGISFRFTGRVPQSEVRGCGNIERMRSSISRQAKVA